MTLTDIAAKARPKLSAERERFRELFYAGQMAEARRLAERCYDAGTERVAWIHNLGLIGIEQGNLREAYTLFRTHSYLLSDCEDLYAVGNFHLSFGLVCKRLYELLGESDYFDLASVEYIAAAEAFNGAGAQTCEAYALNCYANLLIVANHASDAFPHIEAAQLLFNDAGEIARAADCEDTRALALEALEQYLDAYEAASRAYVTLKRCGASEAKSIAQVEETLERVYAKLKSSSAETRARLAGRVKG